MQSRHVLAFPGEREAIERAFIDLRGALDGHALGPRARYTCELVFEEIVTNIIKHAYRDDGEHTIELTVDFPDEAIVMRFEDDGVPFDPTHYPPMPPAKSILEASIGGRGLFLVRSRARQFEYERTPADRNRLTVTIGRD